MLILALDTAGVACSVAILDADTGSIVASASETIGRGHAERLMAMIDEVMAAGAISLPRLAGLQLASALGLLPA